MNRIGYIRGGDLRTKRPEIAAEGKVPVQSQHWVNEIDRKRSRTGDWRKDQPKLAELIDNLRAGTVVVVKEFGDLANNPQDALLRVAEISASGGSVYVTSSRKTYCLPAATASMVTELGADLKAHFNDLRTRKTRAAQKASGRRPGRISILETIDEKLLSEVKSIWSDPQLSISEAEGKINSILPEGKSIKWGALRNYFGNKTEADGTAEK